MSDRHASYARAIVVVEDDALLRDLAMSEIEDAGFRPVGFATADAALEHLTLHSSQTAVLFTDVQMPGRLNGLELVAIVSRTWPSIGILLTSGGSLVNPARLPGRVQFVTKPWRGADLVERIGGMARGAGAVRARLDAAML